jgi:hypothetical protein
MALVVEEEARLEVHLVEVVLAALQELVVQY